MIVSIDRDIGGERTKGACLHRETHKGQRTGLSIKEGWRDRRREGEN